ncbi:class II glutamine amidotransferase [Candidatus Sodalis endolongispinus]|uniref:Class II glutamine amidotransferase n=1 Tax=Candidatus Sodalis endolongispinus TaxID=2812662 RepID=A0ABS5Y9G6_9GAMM|nr:class II glutamine amidotransferase [Candidatus Sodalis endolongispinus]MBT9431641.1 class II glutamine amidotransferase [Candidatus Sodalis endolongispinus]
MCELLGMSANVPTDICFSFSGLVQRGGGTGPHKDGCGITFYEGLGCRTFKDPLPSIDSPIARLVQDYPIKSCAVVPHIRQANRGRVALENTHPFTRELWGRHWTFAHNGQLRGYRTLQTGNFRPVGQTDSEQAFCWLLARLAERYPHTPRHWPSVFRYIAELADTLRQKGIFNMLLSDGCYVMGYCASHLYWITRRAPFGKATLLDQDVKIDFQKQTTPNDVVTVIATQPLTGNETWQRVAPAEWVLFRLGEREL